MRLEAFELTKGFLCHAALRVTPGEHRTCCMKRALSASICLVIPVPPPSIIRMSQSRTVMSMASSFDSGSSCAHNCLTRNESLNRPAFCGKLSWRATIAEWRSNFVPTILSGATILSVLQRFLSSHHIGPIPPPFLSCLLCSSSLLFRLFFYDRFVGHRLSWLSTAIFHSNSLKASFSHDHVCFFWQSVFVDNLTTQHIGM